VRRSMPLFPDCNKYPLEDVGSFVTISPSLTGEIRMWDPKNGKAVGQPMRGHKKWITSLAFEPLHADPTCRRFASSGKDNTIKIWNVQTGTCDRTISGHTDSVECVKWGGAGLLYSCSRDRTIKVWEIDAHGRSQEKLIRTLTGHAHRINSLALNCDYALRTGAYELGLPSPTDPTEIQAKALAKYQAMVGSEGEKLVSGSDDFTLFLWNPQHDKAPITRMTGTLRQFFHVIVIVRTADTLCERDRLND
jgi:ribosome assembly protein 4